jgi:hypothetical protein
VTEKQPYFWCEVFAVVIIFFLWDCKVAVYKTSCSEQVGIVTVFKTCTWELLGLNLSQGTGYPD